MNKMSKTELLADLRRRHDWHVAHGNTAQALSLNDRLKDLKEGRLSVSVERAMRAFESGLERRWKPRSVQ